MQSYLTISESMLDEDPYHSDILSLVELENGNITLSNYYAMTVFITLYDGLLFFKSSLHTNITSSL